MSNSLTSLRSSPRRLCTRTTSSPLPLESRSCSSEESPQQKTPTTKRRRVVTPLSSPQDTAIPDASVSSSQRTPDENFVDLEIPPGELRPCATLTNGQCFNWRAMTEASADNDDNNTLAGQKATSAWGTHNETQWLGTMRVSTTGQSVVLIIRETPSTTMYRVLYAPPDLDMNQFLSDYFQLDECLVDLYKSWSQADERLSRIAQCIPGVRIINQDPWECLASFICSSNNNIPRITKILSSIRREYGNLLIPAGEHGLEDPIYSFPSLKELLDKATDKDLREKCGIGYRSKYILETMKLLDSLGGEPYLHRLKEGSQSGKLSPADVQGNMIKFAGCGMKVADCVALFSLKQAEATPVDVHVWNIACRDYDPNGELRGVKSLTPTVYRKVEERFRSRFQKAGWAQSLLFVAELPSFRPVLPHDIVEEMDKFRSEEKSRKKSKK